MITNNYLLLEQSVGNSDNAWHPLFNTLSNGSTHNSQVNSYVVVQFTLAVLRTTDVIELVMADLIFQFMLFVFCPLAVVLFSIKIVCVVKELFCPLKRVRVSVVGVREIGSRLGEHSTYTL